MTRPAVRGRSVERTGRPRRSCRSYRGGAVIVRWAALTGIVGGGPLLAACGVADSRVGTGAAPEPAAAPTARGHAAAPAAGIEQGFRAGALETPIRQVVPPPSGLDLYRPTPDENPLTAERAELGRRLFFDTRLSRDGSVACASCHRPELGFSDTLRFSPGVEGRTGRRATPTLLNRAYGRAFFWDGRIATLERAVLQPIENPVEMDLSLEELVGRLEGDPGYRRAFAEAFGGEPVSGKAVGRALASYVRVLLRGDAQGQEGAGDVFAREVAAGRELFLGRARCANCHAGPNFTQEEFHNTGVAGLSGDPGRYAVTGRDEDRGRFKTPTLRGVRHTRPYMHDGSLPTLTAVLEFYDHGGGPHPNRTSDLRPLELTPTEIRSLVAFLESL